ncbi:hypothetical protein FRB94_003597 [Tulasnella sp. JGI-2019a]|nr:hypothetical protein FRB94_003597 [Tulasnella sp. JGI-2019a]
MGRLVPELARRCVSYRFAMFVSSPLRQDWAAPGVEISSSRSLRDRRSNILHLLLADQFDMLAPGHCTTLVGRSPGPDESDSELISNRHVSNHRERKLIHGYFLSMDNIYPSVWTPYLGVAIFVNYVFQMMVVLAPMMMFAHLSKRVVSQMQNINAVGTERPTDKDSPHQAFSTGVVSTTIAFQPPLSLSEANEYPLHGSSGQ